MEPNASERAWIAAHVAAARSLIDETIHPLKAGEPIDPDALDAIWAGWLDQPAIEVRDANGMINMIGLALGQTLVDRLGLKWKVVQDGQSTEIAVHGAVGDVLIFPTNLVAKRYVSRTRHFITEVVASIESEVRRIRFAHGAH